MVGPTASGKSRLAEALAGDMGAQVVSVDSMQVYRGMDIGTAKPDAATRDRFGYHLVDLVDPADELTVAEYQAIGAPLLDRLTADEQPVVLAGGSGLHLRALVDPLRFPPTDDELRSELEAVAPRDLLEELMEADPGAGEVVDLANPRRVLRAVEVYRLTGQTPSSRVQSSEAVAVREYAAARPFVGIGIDAGPDLERRAVARLDDMLDDGLIDEVADLSATMGRTARKAVGYQQLLPVIAGDISLEEGRQQAIRATLTLAKRQRTFFRRDPRIHWIPWHHELDERLAAALSHLGESWTS